MSHWLLVGFLDICFLWPRNSFEEHWSDILLNTPHLGSYYFSIHLDCRFWEGDNKGELPFSSCHINIMYNQYDLSLDQMFNCPFLTSVLSWPVFCQASLLSTNPWTVLVPRPEQTLKWRMCLTYALFLKSADYTETHPLSNHKIIYLLICPRY